MRQTKCFALTGKDCSALTVGKCYGQCAFYKTREEHERSCSAAFARIASLPHEEQLAIAERHYGGFFPWVSEVKI